MHEFPSDPLAQMSIAESLYEQIKEHHGCNIAMARLAVACLSEGPLKKTISDFLERIDHQPAIDGNR